MVQPLVTVPLICWNHAPFIEHSIRSALNQTRKNIELIVFDNGSSDESAAVIQRLANQHGFTFVRQDNIGLLPALNKGLALARGKYFAPLDGDDMWLPTKIEHQVAFFESHPDVHLICGAMTAIDSEGNPCDWQPNNGTPGEVTFESLMLEGCSVQSPTVMYRTETLREFGGFDERVRLDDYVMSLLFSRAGRTVHNTGEMYTLYRRHAGNWSGKPLWHDRWLVGQFFRDSPLYAEFIKNNLSGYFRHLAGNRKREAINLLLREPIEWTWNDVGIGLIKLVLPASLARRRN
jgi:alpha-1,3-rhamnosyltransferase